MPVNESLRKVMFLTDIHAANPVASSKGWGDSGLGCRSSMDNPNFEKWREIAEAILRENDPDSVSRLVSELCHALDSAAAGTGPGSATETSTPSRARSHPAESSSNQMD